MLRILVIEDSPVNMALTVAILENAGHAVLQADHAQSGMELARSERPDLILMDIQLPDLDGLAAGSSHLYRAYPALPDLRAPDGFPVGAIHGMVGMMKKLREDIPCEHAACVFDAPGRTFRDDWYGEYKATRKSMPDDLALQIAPIHEVVKLLGWPVLEVPGVEADDVIGTLACAAAKGGHKVVVSTGDKD